MPPAFAALAQAARAMGKGVVAIKSGKTELRRTAAASHTASLAGGGAASSAFLRQIGVAEVNTPSELIETLKIFHVHGPQIGHAAVLSVLFRRRGGAGGGSGGALSGSTFRRCRRRRMIGCLPFWARSRPSPTRSDYHTFIWGDGPKTTEVFTAMLEAYDAGIYIIDAPRRTAAILRAISRPLTPSSLRRRRRGRPALPVASMAENLGEARVEAMMDQGVCALLGLETALAAIKAAQTAPGPDGLAAVGAVAPRETRMLSEAEGKALLARPGWRCRGRCRDRRWRRWTWRGCTAPYALKGLGFAHKTEAGAVRLGLTSLEGQAEMPGATGYLVEEMVTGAVAEVLLGLRRDPVYGVTLTLGMGGVTAEVLADTVTLVLPATEEDILAALRRLRLWPLLDGYRGRPRADMAAVADIAVRLGGLMPADAALEEIEINPVLVRRHGAVAVDALVQEGLKWRCVWTDR